MSIPVFSEVIDKDEISDSLNISTSQISTDLLAQVVSTGLRDIIVPVKSIEFLDAIRPDMEKVKKSARNTILLYIMFFLWTLHMEPMLIAGTLHRYMVFRRNLQQEHQAARLHVTCITMEK